MSTNNPTKLTTEPGKQELFVIREFDAPRELVFKAFTTPEYVLRWLGPKDLTMKIEKYDARTGGSYRYIHSDNNGNTYAFNGVFHDITFPERAIQTFEFEGLPEKGHVTLDTATFEVLPNNRTRLTIQSVFKSVADRDGMIQSGMERGLNEGFERLVEVLKEMK